MNPRPEYDEMIARAARRELVWVSRPNFPTLSATLIRWSSQPRVQLPSGKYLTVRPEDVLVRRPS